MRTKKISSPKATGDAGGSFENDVQTAFAILMLSGGYAPCFSGFPITEIQLQGAEDGYSTEDMIVTVEDNDNEPCKLLVEIKSSVKITKSDKEFREVIQAAWNDFIDSDIFNQKKDFIALITGPLSATDEEHVQSLLWQAKSTTAEDFFQKMDKPSTHQKTKEKFDAIKEHLEAANEVVNGNRYVSRDILHKFLNRFYIFDYDLGEKDGVVLSLVHSHLAEYEHPRRIWDRALSYVKRMNAKGGKIIYDHLLDEVKDVLERRKVERMPLAFKAHVEKAKLYWAQHPDAKYLALAVLIGGWNEKNENDINIIGQLFDIRYDVWLQKARDILNSLDTPLSYKNGIWQVVNKVSLLKIVGKHIFDSHLESFKDIAISVLKEPVFQIQPEKRYATDYSGALIGGIAEGLALLGNRDAAVLERCSSGKAKNTSIQVIRHIFTQADSDLWERLTILLPDLAEAAPDIFLNAIEKSLEGKDFWGGGHYLIGVLWALERLAWDKNYLVRVCLLLGELSKRAAGGQSANRPSNSLVTILLPWFPQTLAPVTERKAAVEIIRDKHSDVAWNLILLLLPGQQSSSFGSNKPKWRQSVPDNKEIRVTDKEYWEQSSFYADLAVKMAGHDIEKLSQLIDCFDSLPSDIFNQLIDVLSSPAISELSEAQRLPLWERLIKFAHKHRKHADTKWALPDEYVEKIAEVAEKLKPINPFYLYQYLFIAHNHELYDGGGSWEEQKKRLEAKREKAVNEIFQQDGMDGIMHFADSVASPFDVGYALASIESDENQKILFPDFLKEGNHRHEDLARGFIWKQQSINNGWEWGDSLDKSEWTSAQIGYFLACFRFGKQAWDRAYQWLGENEGEYWTRVIYPYSKDDISIAVDKFFKYDKPYMAIDCLLNHLYGNEPKQSIDVNQYIKALHVILSDKSSDDKIGVIDIAKLMEFLQSSPDISQEELFNIERSYFLLSGRFYDAVRPETIERKLANEPVFFHEIISLACPSKKEPRKEVPEETQEIVMNVYTLLRNWKILPGMQDGMLNSEEFNKWLQQVKELCLETGHWESAMRKFGKVLIHAPSDPSGLWIHRTVATALNAKDADDMRSGFTSGIRNSRGVHTVDPTGEQEKALAKKYHEKADAVENAGFYKLADSLRKEVAKYYEQEAQRVIDEHSD